MERAAYRIMDANFNRSREGLRVIEEYCRFVLESASLTARAKDLRHRLCAAIATLDGGKLAACRDSQTDVGRGMVVDNQMSRADLGDCLTAAVRRLPEALRALAETAKTIDPALAGTLEDLRFTSYTLEKDITLASNARERFKTVGLYVLIPAGPDTDHAQVLDLASACAENGADCLQLRAKGLSDDRIFALACEITKMCKEDRIISIINDRTDIAVAAGTDGVHLGQNDLPIAQARKLQNKPMIIGLSTHTTAQLRDALSQNPDYVALGPVFDTQTKPAEPTAGLEYLKQAVKILHDDPIPHVAIGGITLDNVDEVLAIGAHTVAICSAITHAPDPAKACARFRDKIGDFA